MSNLDKTVLVAGGGPVGLAMAWDLTRHGVPVRIIDKATEENTLSKAVVIMPRTLEELELRGLVDPFIEGGKKMNTYCIYADNKLSMRADFEPLASTHNYMLCLPQVDTEKILREALREQGIEVELDTELVAFEDKGDHVHTTIRTPDGDEKDYNYKYLMGCDGAHSVVRHGLDLEFKGSQYADVWCLGDVKIDWNYPDDHACSFFTPEGYLAVFPMPEGRWRCFAVRENDDLMPNETTVEQLQGYFDEWTWLKTRIYDPHWLARFHCHHRRVNKYKVGNVFVSGDAAHIHSPETGLGMNTGMQDAFNLAWKIALVEKGRISPDVLETYSDERAHVGKEVIKISDQAHKMSAQFNIAGRKARDTMFRLFGQAVHWTFESMQKQVQLRISYKKADKNWLEDHTHHRHLLNYRHLPVPGERALDGSVVVEGETEATTLYTQMQPSINAQLLLFSGMEVTDEGMEALRACSQAASQHGDLIDQHLVMSREDLVGADGIDATRLFDPSLELHEAYCAEKAAVFMIRPDGYMSFRAIPAHSDSLGKYLDRVLIK